MGQNAKNGMDTDDKSTRNTNSSVERRIRMVFLL
jgi:hypothetical protein